MKKLTTEEFIRKAKEVHGDKYDYSKVNYVNSETKVCITCLEHGDFWQSPNNHLRGHGCPNCNGGTAINKDEFIERAREIHGDKYDYSKVNYVNSETKVCITCPIHGDFWQRPDDHIIGKGCPSCAGVKKLTTEEFIEKARKIHGNKYGYDKVNYINALTPVCITCPIHGDFWQRPHDLLFGHGCPKCSGGVRLTLDEFIERAREIHWDKYDYSKVNYVNSETKVCITCPIHGDFWQLPSVHIYGSGCPKCKESKLEANIRQFLRNNNIVYETEKTWDWLVYNSYQFVDFYLPEYNIVIECQGKQHFESVDFFGGEENFKSIIERDQNKLKLCEEHNIKILYYSNLSTKDNKYNYPYEVIESTEELLIKIKRAKI